MMQTTVFDAEKSSSLYRNDHDMNDKGNSKYKQLNTDNHMKSNRRSSDSLRYLKYSDSFNRENHFRRHKPYNKYLNHKRECFRNKINQNIEKSSNDRREFTRKHYNKKNVSNESQSVAQSEHAQEKINTAESHFKDVKHKNIKPSSFHSPSTSLINQSMEQKGKEIDKDLLNSLSKNHKTNVLDPPMPPILREKHSIPSTSSEKDPKKVKVRKLPNSPEHVQENINTGDSYFKDIKYKNIKPSAFLSPCNKEKPSKIISKRPSVIKSNSPIENPNRNLNEFNKLKKVGEGAYGTVYKAIDLKSNELVAMKKVKMEHENEGFPITAVREIKILRQLIHMNVVSLREVISDQKDIYLVFEYMNHDLMGLLQNKFVCFNESSIFSIIKQILEGLEYCHSKNFLHRDMKCSNILLNNKGEVKLGDFGLSRFYDAAFPGRPYTNKVISLWYRPIELLLGEESYGFGIDIWSCGCILAQLFTRRTLFPARSEMELIEAITTLCGTPSISDWPEVINLPYYRTLTFKSKRRQLLKVYQQLMPDLALQLLDQMLKLNPMKRITASEALKSPWIIFNNERSSSSTRLSLPSWIDCHELQAIIKKKDKH